MKKVPHTNETKNFQHVGGVTIPPGETRDVDPSLLPGYTPDASDASLQSAAPPDLLAELVKGSIKNIVPELPGMSGEDLARAAELEEAGQKRKSLLEAFAAETLRRLTEAAAQVGTSAADAQASGTQAADAPASGADTAKE